MERPARRSPRLHGYDYSQNGAYFVTLCTQQRVCLFGDMVNGEMHLNAAGLMVNALWNELPHKFPDIELDTSVIMPNHFHGIVVILGSAIKTVSLPQIMQWLKTMTTNRYIQGVKQSGWESFSGQLWQRSYYDHIIRNEADLQRIQEYILNHPAHWEADEKLSGKIEGTTHRSRDDTQVVPYEHRRLVISHKCPEMMVSEEGDKCKLMRIMEPLY